jgi:hypothetical protein
MKMNSANAIITKYNHSHRVKAIYFMALGLDRFIPELWFKRLLFSEDSEEYVGYMDYYLDPCANFTCRIMDIELDDCSKTDIEELEIYLRQYGTTIQFLIKDERDKRLASIFSDAVEKIYKEDL